MHLKLCICVSARTLYGRVNLSLQLNFSKVKGYVYAFIEVGGLVILSIKIHIFALP